MVINKHRRFDLLEIHYKQSAGQSSSEIRHQIRGLAQIAPTELGEGGANPEGVWGGWLGNNDVSMEEGPGLARGELIKAFRTSDIFKNYRSRERRRCVALRP